jgi:hypothetical protein
MAFENITIERVYLPTETLGSMYDDATRELLAKTMELPWRDNKRSPDSNEASCVPEGIYLIVKQEPKPGRDYGYFRFKHVPGRGINSATGMSSILIHRITYVKDLLGCVGVGSRFHDFNKDGVPDMAESSVKMEWLYQNLPNEFTLTIKSK